MKKILFDQELRLTIKKQLTKLQNQSFMERFPISLTTAKIQINNTLKFHLTQVKISNIKNPLTSNFDEASENGEFSLTVGGMANRCSPYGDQCVEFSKR